MFQADDSNEVPNQSESSSSGNVEGVGGVAENGGEATSSGQGRSGTGTIGRGDANVSSNQATPGPPFTRRASATHIPPLNRQQQLLLVSFKTDCCTYLYNKCSRFIDLIILKYN